MAETYEAPAALEFVSMRGLTRQTMEFYNVKSLVEKDDVKEVHYPYPNGRTKIRYIPKGFTTKGTADNKSLSLFGMDHFPTGRYLTITEGEFDAMAAFQMMGSKYPAVSVSSAGSAKKDVSDAYDYVNSFERIYLCFDNDEPGQKAAKEVARMFDFNKVYLVQMDKHKDPNAYLMAKDTKAFTDTWWAARRFMPEGIISSYSEIDSIIDEDIEKPSIPYPFPTLEQDTYGIRTGEVVLFKAMEGIGKTEVFRALEHHLLKTTDENLGIVHLEEGKARMVKGLVGYEVQAPIHLPDRAIGKDEIKKVYRELTGRDERVNIYTHFGSDDPDVILNTIRFMVSACGCKYVFLDHITMVVSGLYGDDERRALDYISTRLAMMVEELDFCLFMVSHVNDEGQTRGSRNISKVAHTVINLYRDKLAADPELRNTTMMVIEKNRYAGRTGPSAQLLFDPNTFMINEKIVLPE